MENEVKLEIIPETHLSQIVKAEIDVQISTAKAYPRSLKMFMDKAMSMATITEGIAASCKYAVPRGGGNMEGKSIRLAEIVLSAYGNVRAGARVISNDGKMITAQGICHDLETNTCVTKEVQRKITNKSGQTFTEDMQIVTGNAACSIALRNAIFACIPSALTDEIFDKTKEVARGTMATLPARREKAVAYFKNLGVKDKQITDVLEIKKIEDIDLDKLAILSGFMSTIKNGESTVKDLFDPNPEIALEDLQLLFDTKQNLLAPSEHKRIEEIISKKEVQSYKKALDILNNY
jgi:hypothetical protein